MHQTIFLTIQIAQSKVLSATSAGAFGHDIPSLYNLLTQNLLMIMGFIGAGGILAYRIVRFLFNRTKEKEKKKIVMYQQKEQLSTK